MARAFHQALQGAGVETGLMKHPDEPHGISQPRHRADKLRQILDWFGKYSEE
jgi:dipeptidyl aminopeptidase/acylaminoacyl peptidase